MSTGALNRAVYVVSAVRTPVGRRGLGLAEVHPVDLAASVVREAAARTPIAPNEIDDVILGCVNVIGSQAGNIARLAALAAGLPETVPGVTVDRRCGSSMQAIAFGAQAIASGAEQVVLVGGVESMSRVPIGSPLSLGQREGLGTPYEARRWIDRFPDQEMSQFRGAEIAAKDAGIDRLAMETFAFESHERALRAIDRGILNDYLLPVGLLKRDEGPRPDTTLSKMARLRPVLPGGSITAAVSSQISDGAAALVLASGEAVARHELSPLARVIATSVVGADPVRMVTGPPAATRKVLARAQLEIGDIDRFEVNEAFASVVLAWLADTGAQHAITNVNGGAIALGHPLGATGARMMCDMIAELRSADGRYALQTMCEGAGTASAIVIENC